MKTPDGTTGRLDDIRLGESCEEYCERHLAHAKADNNWILRNREEEFLAKLRGAYVIHKSKRSRMTKEQFITKLIELNDKRTALDTELRALEAKSAELIRLQTLLIEEWGESEN